MVIESDVVVLRWYRLSAVLLFNDDEHFVDEDRQGASNERTKPIDLRLLNKYY